MRIGPITRCWLIWLEQIYIDWFWFFKYLSLLMYFFKTFLVTFPSIFLPFFWLAFHLFFYLFYDWLSDFFPTFPQFVHIFPTFFFDLSFSEKVGPGKELKGPNFLDLKPTWSLLIFQAFTSLLCYNIFEKVLKPISIYIQSC